MKKIRRILLFPFGIIKKCIEIANDGARDIENKIKYRNCIIDKGCFINQKSTIHPNVHILENCAINNSEINSFTYLGKNCQVQNTSIGKFCSIANNVLIGLGNHPLDMFSTSPLFYRKKNTFSLNLVQQDLNFEEYKPIHIGNDVWIGSRAIILDGVVIGNGAVIASNSVVTRNVDPYAIVGGIPAKLIKSRFSDEKIAELLHQKWWDWELEKIKNHYKI